MGLILICVLSIIIGAVLYCCFDSDIVGSTFFWAGVGFLCIFLIAIPLMREDVNCRIAKFNSVQASLDEARSNPVSSGYEAIAIQAEVFEQNKELAKLKYFGNMWFYNIHYPTKKINALEPIR